MKKKLTKQLKPKAKVANNEVVGQATDADSFSVEDKLGELKAILGSESKSDANLQEQLITYEKIIGSAQTQFEEVGRALKFIRDDKLYNGLFNSFEDYCRKKWDYADKHVYRLIDSYKAMKVLRSAQIDESLLPRNEYHARTLLQLSDESRWEQDWRKVLKAAKDDPSKISGSFVKSTLGKPQEGESQKKTRSAVLEKVLSWIKRDKEKLTDLEAAIKLLEKIQKEIESL